MPKKAKTIAEMQSNGGKTAARNMTPAQRKARAKKAARARWPKGKAKK